MNICLLCLFLTFSSVSYGCSLLSVRTSGTGEDMQRPDKGFEAQNLLDKLQQQNSSLISFKGIGNITLQRSGIIYINERMAWISARPLRFSIVILVSGHPVLKLSGDGKWLFYHNPYDKENAYRKLRSNNPILKQLIPVPLKASDFIALMAGCIPIPTHHSVELVSGLNGGDDMLVLKKWWRIRQKIYLDQHGKYPYKMEVFDGKGVLSYGVQLEQIETVDGYTIPMKLTIHTNEKGEPVTCQLVIDRYWPNVSVSSSTFVLSAPE